MNGQGWLQFIFKGALMCVDKEISAKAKNVNLLVGLEEKSEVITIHRLGTINISWKSIQQLLRYVEI